MSELSCVRCSGLLHPLDLEGQTVLACGAGHGLWLTQLQLSNIVEDATDEVSPSAEAIAWSESDDASRAMTMERHRSCPVCGNTLRKDIWKYGSGVVVDACDEHGIWVDSGEVEAIEAWTEAWHAHAQ